MSIQRVSQVISSSLSLSLSLSLSRSLCVCLSVSVQALAFSFVFSVVESWFSITGFNLGTLSWDLVLRSFILGTLVREF